MLEPEIRIPVMVAVQVRNSPKKDFWDYAPATSAVLILDPNTHAARLEPDVSFDVVGIHGLIEAQIVARDDQGNIAFTAWVNPMEISVGQMLTVTTKMRTDHA